MTCSLLSCGVHEDLEYGLQDYTGAVPRWCPGCGDLAVLTAVHRLLEAEQLQPERTVFVSGIGCSSRFPHYVRTYGFHGIHGRALPVATGIKLHRPDLSVFVVMGDGDCCSIGAGHWIHALRYNADLTVLLLDNEIYGLTKNQTSPTTPRGFPSNTQPRGSYLPALNPIQTSLGVTNASFVAQTADWIPDHLFETIRIAHRHRGFSFVRILQRCPQYTSELFEAAMRDPSRVELLSHERGLDLPELRGRFPRHRRHDPADLDGARRLADGIDPIRLGIFFRDETRPRYEEIRRIPARSGDERIHALNEYLDRHAI